MAIAINGSSNTITGLAVGGLPDGVVDNDMIANSTIAEAKLAANVNTITMVDQWRLTANFTLNDTTGSHLTIGSNLERIDTVGQTTLNGGMTHSSGIWTFPETGIYRVDYQMQAYTTSNTNYVDVQMMYDLDGDGTYESIARILQPSLAASYCNGFMSALVDVDNTSNCKLLVRSRTSDNTTTLSGSSGYNRNCFTFMRLGDT
tara:strand:+ start:916 stop:1524 length:609 start_codon:yes stop_codon:yes gene_type:complete